MTLFERQEFLATLDEYAASASGGRSRLVLISGEAGVGKTSLLDAFCARLGVRRLAGACDGSFTPRPLGPLLDVAEQTQGALARACEDGVPRERLFALLREELTSSDLTVLTVEDVHWADEATLDLLRYLGRRVADTNALIVVTYRDDGLPRDHPLRVVVGELGSHAATQRLALPPLSEEAVAQMCGPGTKSAAEVYRLSGGNPFYVTELVASNGDAVPRSAADAVMSRLARLSPAARDVVDAAAVIGARVDVDVLRRVIQTPLDAVDECLTAGALYSDATGFRFRHEIARVSVEESLPAHRRQDLHARVLDVLRKDGSEDWTRLAHHAEGALDAEAVLAFAPAAAAQADAAESHREAAAQYARALRFAGDLAPRERAELLDAFAWQSGVVDQWQESATAREEALQLWQHIGDQLRVGDELRMLATAYWRLTRGTDASQAQHQAIAVLEELPPSIELGWAYTGLASSLMTHGDMAGLEWARKAQDFARTFDDCVLFADAMHIEGCLLVNDPESDREHGLELMRRSLDEAIAAGGRTQAGRAFTNLHAQLACEHQYDEAEALGRTALEYCQERDLWSHAACVNGVHTLVLVDRGRWEEADEFCLELLERAPSPSNRINPLAARALLLTRQGSADAASARAEAAEIAASTGEPQWILGPQLAEVEAAWLEGRYDDARAVARAAVANALVDDSWRQGAVAVWLRRLGAGSDGEVELPWIAEPYALELAGRWQEAGAEWRELGCPYDEGLALLHSGDEASVREAHRLFGDLGAAPAAAKAQRALRELGVTSIPRGARGATRADPDGLTPREREVLAELVEGATNAEIAERLVISEKTAGHHVSSILAKLGVESRRDAARIGASNGTALTRAK